MNPRNSLKLPMETGLVTSIIPTLKVSLDDIWKCFSIKILEKENKRTWLYKLKLTYA